MTTLDELRSRRPRTRDRIGAARADMEHRAGDVLRNDAQTPTHPRGLGIEGLIDPQRLGRQRPQTKGGDDGKADRRGLRRNGGRLCGHPSPSR
jgi:hypothetical protein